MCENEKTRTKSTQISNSAFKNTQRKQKPLNLHRDSDIFYIYFSVNVICVTVISLAEKFHTIFLNVLHDQFKMNIGFGLD